MRSRLFFVLLLAVATAGAQREPKVTGFFTDMHSISESGDVVGTEVWLVYARGHYYAAVQDAEGEPDPPVIVPVNVSGSRIEFTTQQHLISASGAPLPEVPIYYSGTVSKAGLMLSVRWESGYSTEETEIVLE